YAGGGLGYVYNTPALYGTIMGNPDLIALRQNTAATAEAVEVARRFPTALNPVLWIDYRPITLIPPDTFGSMSPGGGGTGGPSNPGGPAGRPQHHSFYHSGQNFLYLSWRQPVELGHQTTHRYAIAKAQYDQAHWTQVQAELQALVQTYRFFQTAAYRREKLRVAQQLADFNDRLEQTLRRRMEAGQVQAADVALTAIETEATRQQLEAARQDYVNALTDLRTQMGLPESAATAEPLGEFLLPPYIPPADDEAFLQAALRNRPEIYAAQAQVQGALAAIRLARADRIPSPIIGPEYEIDEAGVQYVGLVYITPVPVLNTGKALVRQREAEYRRACVALQQVQQRTIAQVKAALAKWNGASRLVAQTAGLTDTLKTQVTALERLFEEGQADLNKLLQARQRLIQLENARLDAIWQATQAQADLLLVIGAQSLLNVLQ
ncbi:MAG: TolC family protein, partial [Isosphaeraceae bacterium]|nr:TolC family protein [Isosphaeraceae bacterium]